jgi:cell division protein FtsB
VVAPALALLAAAATLALDQETGILAMAELKSRVEEAEARIAKLHEEKRWLIRHVRGLRSDPFEIESVARNRLGMVRPDEVVIRLESDAPGVD